MTALEKAARAVVELKRTTCAPEEIDIVRAVLMAVKPEGNDLTACAAAEYIDAVLAGRE